MRYLGKFEIEILKYVVVLVHILEKVLYNPSIPVFIILERHCNIVMWYYHMPRVSQLLKGLGPIRPVKKVIFYFNLNNEFRVKLTVKIKIRNWKLNSTLNVLEFEIEFGILEVWVQEFGILEFWKSRILEFWRSGIFEFWKGILEVEKNGGFWRKKCRILWIFPVLKVTRKVDFDEKMFSDICRSWYMVNKD